MTSRRRQACRVMGVSLLLPGLLLAHPPVAHAETKPAKPSQKSARARPAPASTCGHTVLSGDSLGRIAERHGVPRRAVIAANKLANPDVLHIGQRLTIPGCAAPRPERPVAAAGPAVRPDGTLLASVGPRRVPTQLFLGVPELNGLAIAFVWPAAGPIASPFGRRRTGWHAGVDIKAEVGAPILAAAPGTVFFSSWERSYGRVVRIEHANGFVTVYAHNLQNFVEAGDRVEAGAVIATVGRSGRSTAYHLHFEIRHDGTVYDPVRLLPERDLLLARADEAGDPQGEEDEDE